MDLIDFTGKVGQIIVLEGSFSVRVNGKPYMLQRGDLLVVTPLFIYEDFVASDDLRTESLKVDIHSFLEKMTRHLHISFLQFLFEHPVSQLDEEEMDDCLRRFAAINRQKEQAADETYPERLRALFQLAAQQGTESLVLSMIALIVSKNHEQIFRKISHSEPVSAIVPQFLLALNRDFRSQRSVAYYAKLANLSVGHFSSIIRSKTGSSPMHWITLITLNNAKVLLRNRELSIKEIAQQLGFPEQFTFRKYFKQHTGQSPTEFRETVK